MTDKQIIHDAVELIETINSNTFFSAKRKMILQKLLNSFFNKHDIPLQELAIMFMQKINIMMLINQLFY